MVRVEEITRIDAPVERCFDLARSIEVHVLGNLHFGENALAVGDVNSGLIEMGQTVVWRARHFWVWQTLTSRMTALDRPAFFETPCFAVHSTRCGMSTSFVLCPRAVLR